jgi:hypothetical protein
MNRLVHIAIAGLLAVASYSGVAIVVAGNPDTWHSFTSCDGVGVILCFLAGGITILASLLFIGLPLALLVSGVYLKLMKFPTKSALLVPLTANALTLGIIAACWFLLNTTLPLWAMIAILIAAYLAIGSIHRRPSRAPLN